MSPNLKKLPVTFISKNIFTVKIKNTGENLRMYLKNKPEKILSLFIREIKCFTTHLIGYTLKSNMSLTI